jgi:hypothetical protein
MRAPVQPTEKYMERTPRLRINDDLVMEELSHTENTAASEKMSTATFVDIHEQSNHPEPHTSSLFSAPKRETIRKEQDAE